MELAFEHERSADASANGDIETAAGHRVESAHTCETCEICIVIYQDRRIGKLLRDQLTHRYMFPAEIDTPLRDAIANYPW